MNYVRAPFTRFDIGFYLAEPLMVIVAGYTLVSVVLIGRGVFCGWLCPFGALQELLGQVSRALRVPQRNPPVALERRLRMGKYIAAAAVLMLVITQIDAAGASSAIEPCGKIVTSECFQCLDCQVEYYDETRCPPLARAARLRGDGKPVRVGVTHA